MSKKDTKNWQEIKDACEQEELENLEDRSEDQQETSNEQELEYASREELESLLLAAEKKAQEQTEKAMRAIAELDNVRRRSEREVANAHRFGVEKLVKELIPVMDSLEQAYLTATQQSNQEMAQGIELTIKLLLTALEKFEVVQLNPEGEAFNPQEHEAMSIQISNELPANTVMMVFQKGYKLSDRVVRPARVIVSKTAS